MEIPAATERRELAADVLVIGGGTAGTMAAITAAEHGASVLLLEKAHVRHSGALAMGMDGVNNAVIPGKATPEDYVAEITRANDGIVDQRTVHQTATRGFAMVKRCSGPSSRAKKMGACWRTLSSRARSSCRAIRLRSRWRSAMTVAVTS